MGPLGVGAAEQGLIGAAGREERSIEFFDLPLSPFAFDHGGPVHRVPPRDPLARPHDYEDRADLATVFYDCYWSASGSEVVGLGPRLGSFEALLSETSFIARPSGATVPAQIGERGTLAEVIFPVPAGTRDILAQTPHGTRVIVPQPNEQALFAGKRVLVTQSLNNPLHWIRDWAWFYIKTHGTNAIVFYDNGSHAYGKQDIKAALEPLPGLDLLVLPDWPYRFGAPNDILGHNDSRFSQRGVLEHARQRFLRRASSVINCDIDELIIPLAGTGLHDSVEASRTGYLQIGGCYFERVTEDGALPDVAATTFRSWPYRLREPRLSSKKWAVAPGKHADSVFWTVHRIYGRKPVSEASEQFRLCHIYGMKTEETDERNLTRLPKTPTQAPDPEQHIRDADLERSLASAFNDPAYAALPPQDPFALPSSADAARTLAGVAARSGRLARALDLASHALALAPDRPGYHDFKAQLLRKTGQTREAERAEQVATDLRMSNPEAAAALIRAARGEGNLDQAMALADDALSRNPDAGLLHLAKSDVFAAFGRSDAAAEAADRAVELGLDTVRLHWRRALACVRVGRIDDADISYRAMHRLGISTVMDWLRYYRGMIRVAEMRGEVDRVKVLAAEATETLGDLPEATAAMKSEFAAYLGSGTTSGS